MILIPRNSNPSIQYVHTLTTVNRAGPNTKSMDKYNSQYCYVKCSIKFLYA